MICHRSSCMQMRMLQRCVPFRLERNKVEQAKPQRRSAKRLKTIKNETNKRSTSSWCSKLKKLGPWVHVGGNSGTESAGAANHDEEERWGGSPTAKNTCDQTRWKEIYATARFLMNISQFHIHLKWDMFTDFSSEDRREVRWSQFWPSMNIDELWNFQGKAKGSCAVLCIRTVLQEFGSPTRE